MNKVCISCKIEKSTEEFNKDNSRKDKLNPRCKQCHSIAKKKNRPNEIIKRQKNMDLIYEYLLTHPCVDCKERNPIVLQFDHQHNKKMAISKMLQGHYRFENIKNEIAKCVVRCANCHMIKTAKDFGWSKWRRANEAIVTTP